MLPNAFSAPSELVTRSLDDCQTHSSSQKRVALIKDVGDDLRHSRVGESEVPDSEEERYRYVAPDFTQFLFRPLLAAYRKGMVRAPPGQM